MDAKRIKAKPRGKTALTLHFYRPNSKAGITGVSVLCHKPSGEIKDLALMVNSIEASIQTTLAMADEAGTPRKGVLKIIRQAIPK